MAIRFSSKQIADLIVTAVEGGSDYWCDGIYLQSFVVPIGEEIEKPWYSDPRIYENPFKLKIVPAEGDDPVVIDETFFNRGTDVLVEKYPERITEVLTDNYDADTADVFLQCSVFGEIVYG